MKSKKIVYMITLVDLTNQLNDYLQISLFQDFCVNGIQVEGKKEIRKVATAVTASLNIIEKAALENVDALIVHHGLFWNKDSHVIKV
jgi:putative NIF3 family GTP cyclohydrolase 1 type 2